MPTLYDKLRVIGSLSRGLRSLDNTLAAANMLIQKEALESEPRHLQTGNRSVASIKDHNMDESWAKQFATKCGDEPSLKPVAGIAGCKQRVPRKMAIALLSTETGDGEVTESIRNTLLELQRLDPFVKDKVYELIPKPNRPGSERHWILEQEGLLRFKGAVYVPNEKSIQSELIHIHHDGVTAGHFGVRRTLEVIQRKYFWQSLRKDVKSYVKTCPECQRGKAKTHRTHGELAPIPIPGKP